MGGSSGSPRFELILVRSEVRTANRAMEELEPIPQAVADLIQKRVEQPRPERVDTTAILNGVRMP